MRKFLFFLLLLPLMMVTTGCYQRVQPNNEGILMTNFGQNYPNDYEYVTGKVSTWGWGRQLYQVPMHVRQNTLEPFQIVAQDGGVFTVDPDYTFKPIRGMGRELLWEHSQHREGGDFLETIAETILETMIRNRFKEVAGDYTTDSLMYNRVAYEEEVFQLIKKDFEESHFEVMQIASGLTPPPSMTRAIEARNAAVQKAQQKENELAAAEATQKIAISNARAEVEVARLQRQALEERGRALNSDLLTEMMLKKWDGDLQHLSLEEVIKMLK